MRQEELVLLKEALDLFRELVKNSSRIADSMDQIVHKLESVAEEVCEVGKNLEAKGG